jgi:hypothetical protein
MWWSHAHALIHNASLHLALPPPALYTVKQSSAALRNASSDEIDVGKYGETSVKKPSLDRFF